MRHAQGARARRLVWLTLLAIAAISLTGLATTQVEVVISNTQCTELQTTQFVFLRGGLLIYAGMSYPGTIPPGQSRTFEFDVQQVPTEVQIRGTRDGHALQVNVQAPGQTSFACGTIEVRVGGAAQPGPAAPAPTGTAELTTWMIPSPNALPYGIGIAPDGNVYFAAYSANNIGQLDPTANQIRERSVNGAPYGLHISPSGSLFYTLPEANAIETMVFTGGTGRWNLPTPHASPDVLVSAPTGPGQVNLWIAERGAGKVARFAPSQILLTLPFIMTPATTVMPTTSQLPGTSVSVVREYHPGNPMLPPPIALLVPAATPPFTEWQSPGGLAMVYSVAVAPDGRIWSSEDSAPLVSLDPSTNTALYYGLPSGTEPFAVIAGANGEIWFTDTGRPSIGVLDPATSDVYLWPIPGGTQPFDLVRDADGKLWFTDREADAIGHLNPATDEITMYPLGTNTHPTFLVLDEQSRVWFTAERANYVGRLSVSAQPQPGPVPLPSGQGQGTLEISSTPPGAQVYIDGTYRGTTPVTVPLAAGPHTVVLRMPGFPDAQRTITIYAGSRHTMSATFGIQP